MFADIQRRTYSVVKQQKIAFLCVSSWLCQQVLSKKTISISSDEPQASIEGSWNHLKLPLDANQRRLIQTVAVSSNFCSSQDDKNEEEDAHFGLLEEINHPITPMASEVNV